jgi:tripartite-type tricarboxylate transporter receptor subunit TctC
MKHTGLRAICLIAAFGLGIGAAAAQDTFPVPGKPIMLVSGFAPGGIAGRSMQDFAPFFERELGVPVQAEAIPGAAGLIAYNTVFGRPADGHSILLASGTYGPHIYPHLVEMELPWTNEDWLPLGLFSDTPSTGIMVLADSPYKTFPDLIRAARENPGELNFGTVGPGRIEDIQIVEFQEFFDVEFNHVYYDSGSTVFTDLLTGDLDVIMAASVGYVDNPDVNILTLLAKEIPEEFPHKHLHTLADFQEDLGYDVADLRTLISTLSNGLVVKAGLSDEAYEKLKAAFEAVITDPEWQETVKDYREPAYYSAERAKEVYDGLNESIAAIAASQR